MGSAAEGVVTDASYRYGVALVFNCGRDDNITGVIIVGQGIAGVAATPIGDFRDHADISGLHFEVYVVGDGDDRVVSSIRFVAPTGVVAPTGIASSSRVARIIAPGTSQGHELAGVAPVAHAVAAPAVGLHTGEVGGLGGEVLERLRGNAAHRNLGVGSCGETRVAAVL